MSDANDFSPPSAMSSPTRNAHYDIESVAPPALGRSHSTRSNIEPGINKTPSMVRRRGTTFATVNVAPLRPNWHPGQEPGLDPSKTNGGRAEIPILHEECEITIVDFSEDSMDMNRYDNAGLIRQLGKKQEDWIKCRWINVNGLSWDVIQALGKHKKLHRLSIEDLVNNHNRTKADWYTDHTYLVLTLQKLVELHKNGDSASDSDSQLDHESFTSSKRTKHGRVTKALRKIFHRKRTQTEFPMEQDTTSKSAVGVHGHAVNGFPNGATEPTPAVPVQKLRTLHRYHGGPNQERTLFLEKNSALTKRNQVVSVEQVSIFLTSDNTIISFFESSAEDIQRPILHRLSTPDTILRRSCDASMLMQAIIDAIIDLAIPVTYAYQDVIGALELDVLTAPDISHTTSLYIITSEITTLRNFVSPITNLINSLRDHKTGFKPDINSRVDAQKAASAVKISDMSQTYLADVEDHIVLILESLDQMRRNADGMIDLIFNRISAYQNESMKQLTIVTIIFLPLSFLVGYFGMNFTDMPSINHNEIYFWKIAIPVAFVVIAFLTRDMITWSVKSMLQKRGISRSRKGRLVKEATLKQKHR